MRIQSLKGYFIIATPSLDAGIFKSSVTYICEHNEQGAMGIIVNRPSKLTVAEVLDDHDVGAGPFSSTPVLLGGPVGVQRGFVLHSGVGSSSWESSMPVDSDIYLTGSKDILRALSVENGPENFLLTLGYAGWDSGQLEQELADNQWLAVPADADILFETPIDQRFDKALGLLGVDPASLSSMGGNA